VVWFVGWMQMHMHLALTIVSPPPHLGTIWTVGVNIYPKENDLPLLFVPTTICPLGCLDGGVNVDVDERGRAGPTTNLFQFATF
jgi:hypothetical protein